MNNASGNISHGVKNMGVSLLTVIKGVVVVESPIVLNSPNPLACIAYKLKVPTLYKTTLYVLLVPSNLVISATFVDDELIILKIIGVLVCTLLNITVNFTGLLLL